MSDELILDVSFDSQTVTDATENWTLSGTPNVTYEQISGGSGYSLVTGSLGTPPTLVAVDQAVVYNEYTIDFNLYIKPSYTDTGWFSLFSLYAGMNYSGDYRARVYNGLAISLTVGGSSPEVTIDLPTGRWIHITIISEYDSDTGAYTAYLYADSVLRTYRQGTRSNGSPFAIGKKLVLFNRGYSNFFLPNTPGLAIDNLTVIAGIHVPNQTPAISLPNLSRVLNNFCTWLSSQLSAVAKSGAYSDLTGTPTIPTVNNATLTIQQNGTTLDTFTANASVDKTINISTADDTKIPLAGSNAISGSLIPATDGTVNLGGPSYQWNQAYIKSLTINGVACGDILTHNASEFVGISGDQTIGGVKTFSDGVVGNVSSTGALTLQSKDGVARIYLRDALASNFPNSVNLYSTAAGQQYGVFLNGNSFHPISDGMNLGVSSRKWKTFNGINPGALSLPSMNYISLDTTNFDVTATIIGTFTPTVDGWAILSMTQKNKPFGIWILLASYRVTFQSVYHQGDYMIFALIPVRANVTMTVYCTADDIDSTRKIDWLKLFPCQGNV